jgi:hypothetical protein
MNFKNQFVAHRKIDVLYLTPIKEHGSKGHVIDFCLTKNAIIESAINKGNVHKIALREITGIESTALKFLEINSLFIIGNVVVLNIK